MDKFGQKKTKNLLIIKSNKKKKISKIFEIFYLKNYKNKILVPITITISTK